MYGRFLEDEDVVVQSLLWPGLPVVVLFTTGVPTAVGEGEEESEKRSNTEGEGGGIPDFRL